MNAYWDRIKFEIENRYNPDVKKYYVYFPPEVDAGGDDGSNRDEPKQYFLGEIVEGIYFTEREYQCARLLILGYTFLGIAKELKLSDRTVETYILNMKNKVKVKTKMALVDIILKSDLVF